MEIIIALLFWLAVLAVAAYLFYRLIIFNRKMDIKNFESRIKKLDAPSLQKKQMLQSICLPMIMGHLDALESKYMHLYRRDRYGVEDREKWDNEIDFFIRNVISPKYPLRIDWEFDFVHKLIDEEVQKNAWQRKPNVGKPDDMLWTEDGKS